MIVETILLTLIILNLVAMSVSAFQGRNNLLLALAILQTILSIVFLLKVTGLQL